MTLPDGTATMVAILNQSVPAEQALLFRPGGSGPGFEHNPYRVVRFKNRTPYLLEPGPISVYASGGLVGEGLADPIAADAGVIIPFAVEPAVVVQSAQKTSVAEERALQLRGGALLVESAQLLVTRYTVRGPRPERPYRVLLRHPRAGGAFALRPRPEGTEELADAYLIPVNIPAGPGPVEAQIEVVERQPQRATVALWDGRAAELLGAAVATAGLDAAVAYIERHPAAYVALARTAGYHPKLSEVFEFAVRAALGRAFSAAKLDRAELMSVKGLHRRPDDDDRGGMPGRDRAPHLPPAQRGEPCRAPDMPAMPGAASTDCVATIDS